MRIAVALVCTLLFSLTLPSLSYAGSNCDDAGSASEIRDCLRDNDNDQKGKGNCNEKGNCGNAKGKAKGHDKDDDDYEVSCMEILNRDRRRECIERRS